MACRFLPGARWYSAPTNARPSRRLSILLGLQQREVGGPGHGALSGTGVVAAARSGPDIGAGIGGRSPLWSESAGVPGDGRHSVRGQVPCGACGFVMRTTGYACEQSPVTTGAVTSATYDFMGRRLSGTQVERYPTLQSLTTLDTYDTSGNLASVKSPAGVLTSYGYDAAGENTSVTDGANNTTSYAYDEAGLPVKTANPDGTFSTAGYDSAGNQTGTADFSASGAQLRSVSAAYDGDGNMVSSTDAMGVTKTFTYDATGVLAGEVQPVTPTSSVAVGFGYDLGGNQTAYTDGNGHSTYATFNSLGLAESVIEPQAGANTSPGALTGTTVYDAAGDVVAQDLPGGVAVSDSYDVMGNLTGQAGSGAAAVTAARTFGYDANGRVTSAATAAAGTAGSAGYQPATSESFTYDDRGLVLSASGSAGASSFGYDADGRMTSRADASGTSSFTYDPAGRLATAADAASGTTGTYAYNSMDQVSSVSYGTGNDRQLLAYDSLHRLTADTVQTSAGAQVASIGYGYNANNNVTSMTTSGLAAPGGGTGTVSNTYSYDEAGRLTGWDNGTAHAYGYDKAGNLTSDNGATFTYDARNQLTSDGASTYTYTADGDVASQTSAQGVTSTFTSDAYQQQVTAAASSYGYDALGRLLTAGTPASPVRLTYSGMGDQVASDASATYSRDPSGSVTGVNTAAGVKTVALTDQHMDLSGMFTAAGTTLAGSATFDPWGTVVASTGSAVQAGFQGGWTDPVTHLVHMGARFYDPAAGQFLSQDPVTTPAQGDPAAGGDLHAYVDDSPVTGTDPTGHMLDAPTGGGCAADRDTVLVHVLEEARELPVGRHLMQRPGRPGDRVQRREDQGEDQHDRDQPVDQLAASTDPEHRQSRSGRRSSSGRPTPAVPSVLEPRTMMKATGIIT